MGYIHVIFFFLFLSRSLARCERIQYRESRDARVCTRGHSMHSTENPRVNTRGPFCRSRSRCPRTRRYRRAQPPRIYCQSRVTRLSVTTAEDRRRYLIAMVNVPLALVVTSEGFERRASDSRPMRSRPGDRYPRISIFADHRGPDPDLKFA